MSSVIQTFAVGRIHLLYATQAEWAADDPVLALGEPGFEWDTGRFKIGDGSTSWNQLGYAAITRQELLAKGYLNEQQVSDLVAQKLGLASGLTELVSAFNQAITDSQSSSQALASQLAGKATQAGLDREITDREAADTTLAQSITVEQVARQQADSALSNRIDQKVNTAGAAAAAPVQSVNTKTGNVNLVKADIGLGSVDNTPDSDKPVSTAQATALSGKIDKQTGAVSGNLAMFATGGGVVDSGIAIPADGVLTPGYQDFTNVTGTSVQITRDDNISSGPLQLSTIPLLSNSSAIVLTSNGDAYPYKSGLFGKITGRITATMTEAGAVTLSGVPAIGYQNDIRIWFVYYCPLSESLLTRKTLCPASAQVNISGLDSAGLATDDDVAGLQTQIDAKEAQITAGQSTQYLDGSKSWRDFGVSVLNSVLTGWQAGADITVSATNTISGAISVLQGQITAIKTTLTGKFNTPAGTTSQYVRGDGSVATFPAIPAAQVQSNWGATSGMGQILGKPVLAESATTDTTKAANVKLASPLPVQTAGDVVGGEDLQVAVLKLQAALKTVQTKQPLTLTEPLTFTAFTTNPVKGASRLRDYINAVDDGSGFVTLDFAYCQQSAGTAGSGGLILKLPGELAFDTAFHPLNPAANTAGGIQYASDEFKYLIPCTGFMVNANVSSDMVLGIVPVSANTFCIVFAGTRDYGLGVIAQAANLVSTKVHIMGLFRFKKSA